MRSKKGTGEGRVAIMYASVVVLPQYNIHPYLNYHLFSRLLVSSSLSLSLSHTHTHTHLQLAPYIIGRPEVGAR